MPTGTVSDEEQIYRIDAFPEFGAELKDEMKTAFDELLGPERSEFLGNRFFGVNEANRKFGLFGERHRTLTFKPQEDGRIRINIKEESPENDSTMSYTNYHDEVPEEFRHLFQVEESGEQ